MLLPFELVRERLVATRCIRTNARLGPNEAAVCRTSFPALYAGDCDKLEQAYLANLLAAIRVLLRGECDETLRSRIRDLLSLIIRNGKMLNELVVHQYVFEYWNDIWRDTSDRITLDERYWEGDAAGASTPFASRLLPKIHAEDAYPDIVGKGGPSGRELVLVEVKLGPLDDRAIGQILRYYRIARNACDTTFHDCDIRSVRPILVVREAQPEFWEALPQYFRELLGLYIYQSDQRKGVHLIDGRWLLQSQARERHVGPHRAY